MLTYLPNNPHPGGKYGLSYSALREDYLRYVMMPDDEFVANALEILHFACVVCYLKESGSDNTLSDTGVIHELVHLIIPATRPDAEAEISRIRGTFNLWCCLA